MIYQRLSMYRIVRLYLPPNQLKIKNRIINLQRLKFLRRLSEALESARVKNDEVVPAIISGDRIGMRRLRTGL